jgi:hypothetical protein
VNKIDVPELIHTAVEGPKDKSLPLSYRWAPSTKIYAGTGLVLLILMLFVTYWSFQAVSDTSKTDTASQFSPVSERRTQNPGILPSGDQKRLMITCHERTWISVVIDGQEKREFMLSPQEIVVLNAQDRFELLVGNAGGVKLFMNGRDIEFTGKSGEVKRVKVS